MFRLPIVGEEFAHYRVVSELGQGGFATVFGAVDRGTGERVALKVLHLDGDAYDDDTVRRFRREVAIVSRLASPYTVRLHAYGEERALWAAFELLPGRNLSAVLAEVGTFAPGAVAHILRQVLTSLQEAHALGLLHRDLKPDNIRVFDGEEGPLTIKVLDFGIARAADPDAKVTGTGQLIGTPRYMSPEQLTASELTPASDIYAVGLIGYELLYGASALKGNSLLDQVERLSDPEMFSQVGDSPEHHHLTDILRRMVVADVNRRTGSALAVLHALDAPQAPPPPSQRSGVPVVLGVVSAVILTVILAGVAIVAFSPTPQDEPKTVTTQSRERLFGRESVAAPPPVAPAPEEPPEPLELPAHCITHDGPWPGEGGRLHAYIPEGAADDPPFVFVTISEASTEQLSDYVDYLSMRSHADARKFPVLSLSIHQDPTPEHVLTGIMQDWTLVDEFGELLVLLVREFQETCSSNAPVVLFAEGNGVRRAVLLAHNEPDMFAATILSGPRANVGDRFPMPHHTMPVLAFGHTQDAEAQWAFGLSKVVERGVLPYPTVEMFKNFRGALHCEGTPTEHADGACERWTCSRAPLQTCKVEGGQWWDKSAATFIDAERFKKGGPVADFPYHDVMWDFLDEAL